MRELFPWPKLGCQAIESLSYSEWARLRLCPLKAAFARDPATRHWNRGSTRSAVGNARHRLVEEVESGRRGGLATPSTAWVRTRWETLLNWEHARLARQWGPATVPPIKQWPDTVSTKVRLALDLGGGDADGWSDPAAPAGLAEALGPGPFDQASAPELPFGARLVEVWLKDPVHQLQGRLDRLEHRDEKLTVVDLKSGIGSSPKELIARHRDQMLFYAGLVRANYQRWPELEARAHGGTVGGRAVQPERGGATTSSRF